MVKKKIDIFGYLKNFGIVSASIVTLYGGFKLVDSVLRIVPVVENIQQVQAEQGAQISDIQNQVFDLRDIQDEQVKQLKNITDSYADFLKHNPAVTKEDLIRYLSPIYEEIKKNELTTQYNVPENGAS